ncbi:hypothetical protein OJ253_246 [Cryptosporidium canis]|uniref:Uncharacterized protein n=1 Tax=Cryptosporidium canis TaxID=195482 RepID=A0A9D5DJ59_9CRYT|nr:hypothetical protein OJ253_246 [Cryptosporidium canis]
MGWETDKLIIELSESIDKYGVGLQITKSLREFGVSCSTSNNLRSDNLIISSLQKPNKNKIPHCKIYPKFEYQSHLDKIRWTSLDENSGVLTNNAISLIVVFFLTIDVYDELTRMPKPSFESYFGHEVIDLVFFEAKQFSSYMGTRCIVIWIGTRDCLSQESLLSNNDGFLFGSEKGKISGERQRHIDGSCLDKCITNLLVNYSVDSFEAKNELEASQYLISIVSGLHDIQNRPVSSKYRPKNVSSANGNPWITQIMQIPGLSEDSAKGLESVFKTPKELVRFVKDNLTGKGLVFSKSKLTYMRFCGLPSLLDIEQSPWFKKLTNIHYFCTKGFCTRKLGKSRAKKLVILYGNISQPSKMISDQIL